MSTNPESAIEPASETEAAVSPSGNDRARRADTKEVHVRISIPNYQYLDNLANRFGMRSLSAVVNFLIECHRTDHETPTLGRAPSAVKQRE